MVQNAFAENKLLTALSQAEYERLLPNLESVDLLLGQTLSESNQPLQFAYFPLNSVITLFNVMKDGQRVKAATVGNEGMVGLPLVLETAQIPIQAVSQIPGRALRMRAAVFRAEIQWGHSLYPLLLRYAQTLLSQISQTVACNQVHSGEERCCYLLTMSHDRVGMNELLLTQESLSVLAGVSRAGIKAILNTLERAGLIYCQQGKIHILNRAGLEAASCECYKVVKTEFDHLFNR